MSTEPQKPGMAWRSPSGMTNQATKPVPVHFTKRVVREGAGYRWQLMADSALVGQGFCGKMKEVQAAIKEGKAEARRLNVPGALKKANP